MMNEPTHLPYSSYLPELRGVHPLSSSPATTSLFNPVSYLNSPPTNNGVGLFFEEVTTIFVVGFPEDMQEREFQNMFMFSPGFIGASLKWNYKDQDDDSATAGTSTTTIPEGALLTTTPSTNGKKQMIGFAKFRSRLEALEAVDVISGKKIDQDKDITLKAEMAKKNLHIKRGSIAPNSTTGTPMDTTTSASSTSSSSSSSSSSLTTTNNDNDGNGRSSTKTGDINIPSTSNNSTSTSTNNKNKNKNLMFGYHDSFTFSPLPSDLLSPMVDYKSDPFDSTIDRHPRTGTPTTPVFNDNLFGFRSYSIDGRNPSHAFGGDGPDINPLGIAPRSSISSTTSFTKRMSIKPQNISVPEETSSVDPFYYLSKSSPAPVDRLDSYFSGNSFGSSLMMNNGGNFGINNGGQLRTEYTSGYPQQQQRSNSLMVRPTDTNLADQNPPCNTLYVGNLPSNTIEDELRQLFSKCTGYKRMYFRTKPQGPMCFVEFDDVMYATQTMTDLQGQSLSNSVKGGIRLSFSKNPLFIKPNKDQQRSASRPFLFDPQF
ncbi:hypothetical protein BC941DRAFT_205882 [Chlamydoabsidia padenii]|nr:hypothetical protein BC941DRAFT_205882 [Chlamydoabsidia padenii]